MRQYDTTEFPGNSLMDSLVQRLIQIIPEDGLSLALVDKLGNCWFSHPSELVWLSSDDTLLGDLTDRIDDGHDPVVMAANDTYVVGSQWVTDNTDYGYCILVLPKRNADSVLQNWDLIELILHQINLNAQLFEYSRPSLN